MINSEDELYDYLVGICDYDPGDVSNYLKYHSDEIEYPIANQDLDKLEAKIGDWLGIGINESTELNEGWSSYYGWTSPADVKEALKETEISSLWKYVKNFGNFFCYKRKSDGRPLVCYYLIKKLGNEWGYKDIGLDSSLKYNASVAAWLKKELNEFGSTEENPGDFTEYWNWITNGKKEQDEKQKALEYLRTYTLS